MGFSDSSLNNFEPLTEPPRAGAARVSKYGEGEQVSNQACELR
jgi:hypothetical protein